MVSNITALSVRSNSEKAGSGSMIEPSFFESSCDELLSYKKKLARSLKSVFDISKRTLFLVNHSNKLMKALHISPFPGANEAISNVVGPILAGLSPIFIFTAFDELHHVVTKYQKGERSVNELDIFFKVVDCIKEISSSIWAGLENLVAIEILPADLLTGVPVLQIIFLGLTTVKSLEHGYRSWKLWNDLVAARQQPQGQSLDVKRLDPKRIEKELKGRLMQLALSVASLVAAILIVIALLAVTGQPAFILLAIGLSIKVATSAFLLGKTIVAATQEEGDRSAHFDVENAEIIAPGHCV